MTSMFRIALTLQQNGDVHWMVYAEPGTPPEWLLGEGSAFTWAAATHQAGTLLMKLNRREAS